MDKSEYDPIGIMPERHWKEKRLIELGEVIRRYTRCAKPIDVEWIDEYNRLCKELIGTMQA